MNENNDLQTPATIKSAQTAPKEPALAGNVAARAALLLAGMKGE